MNWYSKNVVDGQLQCRKGARNDMHTIQTMIRVQTYEKKIDIMAVGEAPDQAIII